MSSSHSPNNTDRVLLTGGTSFLGRSLVARLLSGGAAVHIIDRPGSDRSKLSGLPGAPVFHEHDGTIKNMMEIVEDAAPLTVFHLATQYIREHSPSQLDGLVKDNILFGLQLLEAMQAADVRRIINLGTFFQFYDNPDYRPVNLYAATKQAFEDLLTYYSDAHTFTTTTLILFDVYGPGGLRGKLMAAIRHAQAEKTPLNLVDAETVMDLVFIDDVVDALMLAAQDGIEGGPYAISGAERTTLAEVIGVFEQVAGKKIQVNYGAYPTPARTPREPWIGPPLPGWRAKVGLAEGIRRYLAGEA